MFLHYLKEISLVSYYLTWIIVLLRVNRILKKYDKTVEDIQHLWE